MGLFRHLRLDQAGGAVALAQEGLFDLAGGVAGDLGEDQLPGALIPGQGQAEVVHLGHQRRRHQDDPRPHGVPDCAAPRHAEAAPSLAQRGVAPKHIGIVDFIESFCTFSSKRKGAQKNLRRGIAFHTKALPLLAFLFSRRFFLIILK